MEQLGPYQLVDELVSASGGKIFAGRDVKTGAEVCVKTVKTAETDPELIERFYQEARVCGRLNHPNVVSVLRLGEQHGIAFLAMERLIGQDMRQFIDQRGLLTLEDKIEIMARISDGLAHAHSENIIHRDVKPSNVFLEESGNPKILDFGIARVPGSTLTQLGEPIGTPNYMAPEQLNGQEATVQSDLFSAAVVFFEFLTYVHPFGPTNISAKIAQGTPTPLRDVDPSMPESLEVILERGLSKDPASRYQSATQLAATLREAQESLEADRLTLQQSVFELNDKASAIVSDVAPFLKRDMIRSWIHNNQIDVTAVDRIAGQLQNPDGLHYLQLARIFEELRSVLDPLERLGDYVKELEWKLSHLTPPPVPDRPAAAPETARPTTPPPSRPKTVAPKPVPVQTTPQPRTAKPVVPEVKARSKEPRKWPFVLVGVFLIGIAIIASLFVFTPSRPLPPETPVQKVDPPTVSPATPPPPVLSDKVIGQAKTVRESTMSGGPAGQSPGALIPAETELELLGSLPAEWELTRRVPVRSKSDKAAAGWLPLAVLKQVSTEDAAFDLWHARETLPDPRDPIYATALTSLDELNARLFEKTQKYNDPTLILLAQRDIDSAHRSFSSPTAYDKGVFSKAKERFGQIVDRQNNADALARIKQRIDEFDVRLLDFDERLKRAEAALERKDCKGAVYWSDLALEYRSFSNRAKEIKQSCASN